MIKRKNPPYASSQVDAYATQGRISKLLEEYGAKGVQWTAMFTEGKVELAFILEAEIEGVRKEFMVKLTPPPLTTKRRTWNPAKGRHDVVHAPNWSQSMRLLYWYVKTKIEAIAYGLVSAEREFLSEIVVKLPTGEQGRVGDILSSQVINGTLALPQASKPEGEIRDAEYETVKEE